MMSPMVSIVIPCFRQGHLLSTAVRAALNQTHRPLEVIVVNDGSDDNTDEVARSFSPEIRYVSQPNRGLAAARNAGAEIASGEFLHFLDSDDALHPEAMARLVAATRGLTTPLAMMAWQAFEEDPSIPTGDPVYPPAGSEIIPSIFRSLFGPPHNFLSTRELFRRVGGFDERMRGCADWDFWMRQLFAGANPVSIPFVGAYYRQSPNQMSRQRLHMEEELATAVRNALARIRPASSVVRGWGVDPIRMESEFRDRAIRESANVGYLLRKEGYLLRSAKHYYRCLRLGGWQAGVSGLARLPLALFNN